MNQKNVAKRRNIKEFVRALSVLLLACTVCAGLPGQGARAAQADFEKFAYTPRPDDLLGEPYESFSITDDNGPIADLPSAMPTVMSNGYISESGDIAPKPGEDGFLKPLSAPFTDIGDSVIDESALPSLRSDGFVSEPQETLPNVNEGEFIAPISRPAANAKAITTAAELALMSSGNYVLANDIDLSDYNGGKWIPVNATRRISLDGQGHRIYNLNVADANNTNEYAGLFGKCTSPITIKNLGIENGCIDDCIIEDSYVYYNAYAGTFVAYGKATISNSYCRNITLKGRGNRERAGGFCGQSDADIENSYFSGVISVKNISGGLVGSGNVYISRSYANLHDGENIPNGGLLGTGSGEFASCLSLGKSGGGFVGTATGDVTIYDSRSESSSDGGFVNNCDGACNIKFSNCTNAGQCASGFVNSAKDSAVSITDCANIGEATRSGMIGTCGTASIEHSINNGNVTASDDDVGGFIVECTSATVNNCVNNGNISGQYAGGICAMGTVTAKNVLNTGEVAGGGILASGKLEISNSENRGNIIGDTYAGCAGGFLGEGCITAQYCINRGMYECDDNPLKFGGIAGDAVANISYCANYGGLICKDTGDCLHTWYWGGIVGAVSGNSCISDCVNNADAVVDVGNDNRDDIGLGGIIGCASGATTVLRCRNNGNIISNKYRDDTYSNDYYYHGGIVGYSKDSITITDCLNNGEIGGVYTKYAELYLGGILGGRYGSNTVIENCRNDGAVQGGNGIIGGYAEKISYCLNNAAVGVCGIALGGGDIEYCVNKGSAVKAGIAEHATNVTGCKNTGNISAGSGIASYAINVVSCRNEGTINNGCGVTLEADTVVNCVNTGDIYCGDNTLRDSGDKRYASIAMEVRYAESCLNTGNITRGYGMFKNADTIVSCINDGDVGGYSGIAYSAKYVYNCINRGNITGAERYRTDSSNYYMNVGGIVNSGEDGLILSCENYGRLIGYSACVGGIIANSKGMRVYKSANYGDIFCYGPYSLAGGIFSSIDSRSVSYIDTETKNYGTITHDCDSYNNGSCSHVRQVSDYWPLKISSGILPASLTISAPSVIDSGNKLPISANILPTNATERAITWTTSDSNIAYISGANVCGKDEGTCTITARTVNGITAEHTIKVVKNKLIVNVLGVREGSEPYALSGADVSLNGGSVSAKTDESGTVTFDYSKLPANEDIQISVSCGEDYVPYETTISRVLTSLGSNTQKYYLKYREDEIYIKKAILSENGKEYDMLTLADTKGIVMYNADGTANNSEYTFVTIVDWNKCKNNTASHKIWLEGADSRKTLALSEGIKTIKPTLLFDIGEDIYLKASALNDSGETVEYSQRIPMKVNAAKVSVNIPDSEDVSMDKLYFMDKLNLELSMKDIGKFASKFKIENGVLKIEFGSDNKPSKAPLGIFKSKSNVMVYLQGEINIPLVDPKSPDAEWTGTIRSYYGGKFKAESEVRKEKNKVRLFGHTYNFVVASIPLYFEFEVSAAASTEFTAYGPYDKVYLRGEIKPECEISVGGGIGGGINISSVDEGLGGVLKSDNDGEDDFEAKFGPEGKINGELPFRFDIGKSRTDEAMSFEPKITGELNGKLSVKACQFIDISAEVPIGSFEWTKDGVTWEWNGKSSEDKVNTFDTMNTMSVDGKLKPIGRAYLQNGGGFAGGKNIISLMSDGDSTLSEAVYTNIFEAAESQITNIGGENVLYFTADNAERNDGDCLTLYVTKNSGGSWSEPVAINDDGTTDTSISADGGFVIWADSKRTLAESDGLGELLAASEISAAVDTGDGYVTTRLTDNDIYDFSPKIAAYGGKAFAAWLSNSDNDVLARNGVTSLNYAYYDSAWQSVQTIENIGAVSNLYVAYDESGASVMFKNANGEIFRLSGDSLVQCGKVTGRYTGGRINDTEILAYFDSDRNLHIEENSVPTKIIQTEFAKRENPVFAADSNHAFIVWTEPSGIYYTAYANGAWSEKLRLRGDDSYVKELSASVYAGKLSVSCLVKNGDGYDLVVLQSSDGADIVLSDAIIDESSYSDTGKAEYTARVWNNGTKSASVQLNLYDGDDKVGSEDLGTMSPGEVRVVSGTAEIVSGFNKKNITVTAECGEDINTENNTVYVEFGTVDAAIDNAYFEKDAAGKYSLKAELKNAGGSILGSTHVYVRRHSADSEPVYTAEVINFTAGAPVTLSFDEQPENGVYYITAQTDGDENPTNDTALVACDFGEESEVSAAVFENNCFSGKFICPSDSTGAALIASVYGEDGRLLRAVNLGVCREGESIDILQSIPETPGVKSARIYCWSGLKPIGKPVNCKVR